MAQQQEAVDSRLLDLGTREGPGSAQEAAEDEAARHPRRRRTRRLEPGTQSAQGAHLFYQLLSISVRDLSCSCAAPPGREDHDVLFEDTLAFQMQRFLPGGADENTLRHTVGAAINSFREWLSEEGGDSYVDVGLEMAGYLIDREQHDAALSLLSQLPVPADHKRRYRLHNLQGNACLRIPGRVRESGEHFQAALAEASQIPVPDQYRCTRTPTRN